LKLLIAISVIRAKIKPTSPKTIVKTEKPPKVASSRLAGLKYIGFY